MLRAVSAARQYCGPSLPLPPVVLGWTGSECLCLRYNPVAKLVPC